jgi:murein DD-endopeptidase MepM/ murein hydrolase activator NlpD
MWFRMLVLTLLVALLVGGAPSVTPAHGVANVPLYSGGGQASGGGRAVRGSWIWPVTPPHAIARPYLTPPTPYAAGHRGIDIRAAAGSPVLAPDDGVVHFAGFVVDRPVLSIAHGGGVLSSFEPVQSSLTAGDPVRRGEVIGRLLAGHCTAPCLHLGARIGGHYVNPLVFLGGVGWSVLLPSG